MWTLTLFVLTMLWALANSHDYFVNFDSIIYVCPDERSQTFVDTSDVALHRYNETTAVLIGNIKFLKEFEQDTMIELKLEKDLGGFYVMVFSHEICDVCAELANPDSVYERYLERLSFPRHCPFEANAYLIDHLVANPRNLKLYSEMSGSYQVTINIYKRTSEDCWPVGMPFIACLKLDISVERF